MSHNKGKGCVVRLHFPAVVWLSHLLSSVIRVRWKVLFNFSCHKTPIHLLLFVAVNLHKKTNKNAIWFIVFFNIQYAVIDARLNMETCMNIQQGFLPQVCATVTSAEMVTCFSFKFNPEHQFNHRWPLRKRSCNLLVVSPPANSLQCDLRRTYRGKQTKVTTRRKAA